ncbi:MAG: cell wall-binding repeat-containing protein [Actinobacteria bacterium]|nr:cell wall-binding repeat-containing protein [Actinomycetota bacterium]
MYALKTRFGAVNVERLAGDNRYTTAAAIAEYAVGQLLWFGWDGVGLATGTNFPDALAGGVLQGLNGSVMLLTPSNSLHPAAASALSANALEIDTITFFGGAGAISQEVRDGALQLVE